MRSRPTLLLIGLILATAAPARTQTTIKPILEDARQKHALSAMGAITIIDGRIGEPQTVGVIGMGMSKTVTPDARWHLGSCSKSLTAMLAAVMVERGDLRWDQTLGEALADTDIQVHPGYREVTIEQLLGHRGGLPKKMIGRPIRSKLRSGNLSAQQQRRLMTQTYLGEEPAFPPGTRFEYANAGYVIVGHILERIGGKPYEELMAEHIFGPLGLTSAGFGPPQGESEPRGHKRNIPLPPQHRFADNPEGLAPAGRIHMSLHDWARYAQIHLRAARGEAYELLTEDTYRHLHTPLDGQNYAMGWGRPTPAWADGPALSHSGSNTMWRAQIWIAPSRNAAILVTTNHGSDPAKTAIREVVKAISGQL